ncbi:hypothetical protein C4K35_1486 [Pseudomonas chlororaphis subsp. piscium]|nr:hypothetical protein C4K35_1486 [Pseudomonas chlororaphis subsp. piscium]AZC55712.1 hypothetical protein C4K34_1532 [Pseudomonas chlororaphis subsp. piscium]AZC61972.1 hypothetical protein C4K33_1465 [Pseudomonas chlororaphis subsp. piscium]AZC68212.1 hypothetical protein C4K32_1535 [Pseudomonas chlororaphis subsp. piscium]AZC74400.1 hypothetical protein C4K31_1482 [Pseudomonas chlororaphis subsp. piscium]
MSVAQIDIAKGNRARRAVRVGRAQRRGRIFGYATGLCAEAHRHTVIRTGKLHLRSGPTERAITETNRIRKAVCQGRSGSKRLKLRLERSR